MKWAYTFRGWNQYNNTAFPEAIISLWMYPKRDSQGKPIPGYIIFNQFLPLGDDEPESRQLLELCIKNQKDFCNGELKMYNEGGVLINEFHLIDASIHLRSVNDIDAWIVAEWEVRYETFFWDIIGERLSSELQERQRSLPQGYSMHSIEW